MAQQDGPMWISVVAKIHVYSVNTQREKVFYTKYYTKMGQMVTSAKAQNVSKRQKCRLGSLD